VSEKDKEFSKEEKEAIRNLPTYQPKNTPYDKATKYPAPVAEDKK
jgi:hypothetical protein